MEKERWKAKIYLAGWAKDLQYRKDVIQKYGCVVELVDPMSICWDDIYQHVPTHLQDTWLVKRDKRLIVGCDMLLAKVEYLPQGEVSVGTFMEVLYAYERGIPVCLVSSEAEIRDNAWLKFHCKFIFESVDGCFDYLLRQER